MKAKVKSASEMLHEIVRAQDVGSTIDSKWLTNQAKEKGLYVSAGAVSGFIQRAIRKGMLEPLPLVQEDEPTTYRLVQVVMWEFSRRGVGSKVGREVTAKHRSNFKKPLSVVLLSVAEELERVEQLASRGLSDYTTDELLAEIRKRTREVRHVEQG